MDDSIRLLPRALPAITINEMCVQYQILRPAASMFRRSWCTDAGSAARPGKPRQMAEWAGMSTSSARIVPYACRIRFSRARSGFDGSAINAVKAAVFPRWTSERHHGQPSASPL